ncbi:7696_t:CDS:2, partial [Racocetra fulgida]
NIDFDQSYVIVYSRLKPKEKFDLLEHSQEIKFFDYFQCKCKKEKTFRPDLWQYDNRHSDQQSNKQKKNKFDQKEIEVGEQLIENIDSRLNQIEEYAPKSPEYHP